VGAGGDRGGQLEPAARSRLLHRGLALEWVTLGWNVVGLAVLAATAVAARSVALAGFGIDSLIEIGASTVVIWELSGSVNSGRRERALRIIGWAFAALATYLLVQAVVVLAVRFHPGTSAAGTAWTGATAVVMAALATGKARTGRALDNPVLIAEGRVTAVDALLATAVLVGLVLNARLGWWWADPAAGLVIVGYAITEGRAALSPAAQG
jgi:divalent metal cation (Fe/Co/Zn/Cd) transporter